MNFFKSYGQHVKLIIAACMVAVFGFCAYAWVFYDNGVVDYRAFRDKAAVKKMFHDDWQLLQYGDWDKITQDDFDVDFMLDYRSSSQHAAKQNLVLKVLRQSGKTIGFLAYYPHSPYWWQMLFLIVDKDHRGQGNASKLVQYFIDDTVARGAVKLQTFTRLINTSARNVYEKKFGFKDVQHHHDKYMDLVLFPGKK